MNCQKCDDMAVVLETLLSIYRPSAGDESRDVSPLDALFRVLVRRVVCSAGNPARQTVGRVEMLDWSKEELNKFIERAVSELRRRGERLQLPALRDIVSDDFMRGLEASETAIFAAIDNEIFDPNATKEEQDVVNKLRRKIHRLKSDAETDGRFVKQGLRERRNF